MRAVNIGNLKNNLSRYLNEVRQGAEVVITDRNKPIARIVPLTATVDEETELLDLIAEGAARAPKTIDPLPKSFWKERLPGCDLDVIALVREDRDAR